jgi:hypothetical protein
MSKTATKPKGTAEPETGLTVASLTNLPSTEFASSDYDDLSKRTEFLGRVQLYSKGEAIDTGKVRPGHYGIPESKEKIIELGNSIDILVLARRPKAMDLSDIKDIVTVYDSGDPEFQRIKETSSKSNSGCMYGVSFLVCERSTGRFLELFFGGKSSRPVAAEVYPYMPAEDKAPQPLTLKSKLVKNKAGNTWFVPVVVPCSTPIDIDAAKAIDEINKFINPPKTEVVEQPANQRTR